MYMVKELYIKYEDDDGHTYLIKESLFNDFDQSVSDLYDTLYKEDIDAYYNELDDTLDSFGAIRLEGEFHYVVLEKDLIRS